MVAHGAVGGCKPHDPARWRQHRSFRKARIVSLLDASDAPAVAERVAAFAEAGVTTLNVTPLARSSAERVALMSGFRALVG